MLSVYFNVFLHIQFDFSCLYTFVYYDLVVVLPKVFILHLFKVLVILLMKRTKVWRSLHAVAGLR